MWIIAFIYGICIGSFLNVCVYRIPRNESIVFGASHCTSCNTKLKPLDLIPIVSYIALGGKCRYCKEKIHIKYLLFEVMTGALTVLLYMKYGITIEFFGVIILIYTLEVIGVIDYITTYVYTNVIIFGVVSGVIYNVVNFYNGQDIKSSIMGFIIGYGFFILLYLLTKGVGLGDAEIAGIIGLYLGHIMIINILLVAVILGGIVGVTLLIMKKVDRKTEMPFGPYMSIATILVILLDINLF